MEDMNALERQLTSVVRGAMRPPRSVDASAVVRAATTPAPTDRWSALLVPRRRALRTLTEGGYSMFSAVKLVAAGVVVALFGGFLLTGFLVTPQREEAVPAAVTSSPTPEATSELMPTTVRTDILPGVPLTVEALEAGVLRVVSDGQRDLLSENNRGVVAGQDGSIWLLRKNRFVRLGDAQGHQWHEDDREERYGHPEFVVAPDGTVWAAIWSARGEKTTLVLGSYDGEGWRVHEAPSESRSRTP